MFINYNHGLYNRVLLSQSEGLKGYWGQYSLIIPLLHSPITYNLKDKYKLKSTTTIHSLFLLF